MSAIQALLGSLPTAGICAALRVAAKVYTGFFFLCTCSDSYCPLQSVYYSSRRYCALELLIVQVGISPFDAVLGDKQPSIRLQAHTPFVQLVLVLYYPFEGGWCCRHPWAQEQSCSNQHYCRLDRPSIVRSAGELPCSDAILRILVRLELPLPVNTAAILQQSALL